MQEDLLKNFILLSKIAKEKKYAQEYLGLLARRGDIGSIRIGKRWYTTWQWFEEFLENSQKKKNESVSEVQIVQPKEAEVAREIFPVGEIEAIKINVPFIFPEKEKVLVVQPAINIRREEKVAQEQTKIAVSVKTRKDEMTVRKNITVGLGEIRKIGEIGERKIAVGRSRAVQFGISSQKKFFQNPPQRETNFRKVPVEEKNKFAMPYQEIRFDNQAGFVSPDLSSEEKMRVPLFPRFAYAVGFAIILLLVAASAYFAYSGGMFGKGKVAGASDERNAGFLGIQSGSENFLTGASDKIVEAVSISRVVMEAAREKSMNNSQ